MWGFFACQNCCGFRVILSQIFFREKFTKFNLALNPVCENRLKLAWRVFMMFWTIWQREFFGVKSLMGTPLDLKIFRRKKKIQLQVRGQEGIKIKICFSTIKDLLKWENTNIAIFVGQNCYGCRTIWSSISDAFFDRSESFSKLAKKSRMHHMITFIWEFLLRFSRKDVGRIFDGS